MTQETHNTSNFDGYNSAEQAGVALGTKHISELHSLTDDISLAFGSLMGKCWELSQDAQDLLQDIQNEYNVLSHQVLHEIGEISPPTEPTAGGAPRLGGR